jgi:hypothetical protein
MPRVKASAVTAKGKALAAKAQAKAATMPLLPAAETLAAKSTKTNGGDLGFEATLWSTADQLP